MGMKLNGAWHSGASSSITVDTTLITQFQGFSFGQTVSREKVEALGARGDIGYTDGVVHTDNCDAEMPIATYHYLINALSKKGPYIDVPFNVLIQFNNRVDAVQKVELIDCRINAEKDDVKPGSKLQVVKATFMVRKMKRNGKSMTASGSSISGSNVFEIDISF